MNPRLTHSPAPVIARPSGPAALRPPSPGPIALDRSAAAQWRSDEDRWYEQSSSQPGRNFLNEETSSIFDGVGRPQRVAMAGAVPSSSPVRPTAKETPGITYIAEGGALVDNPHALRTPLPAHPLTQKAQTSGRLLPPGLAAMVNGSTSTVGQKIVTVAKRFLGLPYVYGGESPRIGFDCSGLVTYVFRHFGIQLPHRADLQFNYGHYVDKQNLKPGDLVFFRELGGSDIGHVGIYVGNQTFIHASTTGRPIKFDSLLAPNYVRRYMGAKRLATH